MARHRRNPPLQILQAAEFQYAAAQAYLEAEKASRAVARVADRAEDDLNAADRSLARARRTHGPRSRQAKAARSRQYDALLEYGKAVRAEERSDAALDRAEDLYELAAEEYRTQQKVERKLPGKRKPKAKKKAKPEPPEEPEEPEAPPRAGWADVFSLISQNLKLHHLDLNAWVETAGAGPAGGEMTDAYLPFWYVDRRRLTDHEMGFHGRAGAYIVSAMYIWFIVRVPTYYTPVIGPTGVLDASPTPESVAKIARLRKEWERQTSTRSYTYALRGLPYDTGTEMLISEVWAHLHEPVRVGKSSMQRWEGIVDFWSRHKSIPGAQASLILAWTKPTGTVIQEPLNDKGDPT